MIETNTTEIGNPERRAVIEVLWRRAPKLGLSWVDTCALADELLSAMDAARKFVGAELTMISSETDEQAAP